LLGLKAGSKILFYDYEKLDETTEEMAKIAYHLYGPEYSNIMQNSDYIYSSLSEHEVRKQPWGKAGGAAKHQH
jgi:hypothetical protein